MFEKYARQISLPDFGEFGQRRLSESALALIGAGGVGSSALPLLAGAGVGKILIVDADTVSRDNLHRQTLYSSSQVGSSKALSAADRARSINGGIEVEACEAFLGDFEAATCLLGACDMVIDATDSFASRIFISHVCRELGIPQIAASAQGYVAQSFCFGGDFYFDSLLEDKESVSRENSGGLAIFPPAAHMAGVVAASDALRFLAVKKYEIGKFFFADLSRGAFFCKNIV